MHGETVKKNLFNTLPANVENMVSSNNASKGQMGFNWVFKGLKNRYSYAYSLELSIKK